MERYLSKNDYCITDSNKRKKERNNLNVNL